jgi:hypothetical protein
VKDIKDDIGEILGIYLYKKKWWQKVAKNKYLINPLWKDWN